jgi:hypothetical protein
MSVYYKNYPIVRLALTAMEKEQQSLLIVFKNKTSTKKAKVK